MKPWRGPIAVIVIVVIVVDLLMLITGMGPQVVLVAALGIMLGASAWCVSDLADVALGSAGVPSQVAAPPVVRADHRVTRLRSGLLYGRQDDGSLERLRESLVELIDDQLRAAHEVDRQLDPRSATVILGPELTKFVTDEQTARSLAKPRNLANIVTLIEQL